MKNILITIVVALLSLTYSSNSFALGKMGHKLACQIAYEFLPAGTRSEVDKILASLPEEHVTAINKYNYIAEDSKVTFSTACTWADAVKNEKKYKKFKSWHYININRSSDEIAASTCLKRCVTVAIPHHATQLTRGGNKKKKAEALMFLGHWVGDIHQPLHVSFKSDYGGNKRKIEPFVGKCSNLHWYWDQCLLYPSSGVKLEKSADYEALYQQLYNELKADMQSAPLNEWVKSDTIDWANESYDLIRQEDFNYCQMQGDRCDPLAKAPIKITQAYHDKYREVLKQRILQAAVRLSLLVNVTLKS